MYIKRSLEPLVLRYSKHFKVVVVTGPRQVGKTTMLKHLMKQDAQKGFKRNYVSLDNFMLLDTAKNDPELFLQRYQPPVLIDEIQKAPELLPYIKGMVDSSHTTGDFWLTGSQPFHLMKGINESLAGRAGIIEMLGLSNSEIGGWTCEPYNPSPDYFIKRCNIAKAFGVSEAYSRICAGTLPGIRTLPENLRAGAYESYIETYIMRDIRDLTQVGDELKFRRFLRACAALTSKPVVYAELARVADINEKTAKTWLSLLMSSYIVALVEPYHNNLIKRLSKQPIMHFHDPGLAAYLAGWSNPLALETGAFAGQIFETYVFEEIYKSFANAGKKPPLWFFRTNDKKEIDLLMEQNNALFPIEIKKTAAPKKDDFKNFNALNSVQADNIAPELAIFKRKIACGSILCLSSDTFPIGKNVWSFPVWAL